MRVPDQGARVWLVAVWVLLAGQLAGQEYTISTIAGGAPPATPVPAVTASLGTTWGVVTDAAGNVYLSTGSNSVFKVDTAGILTLVAGNSRWGYSGDGGPAISAQLRDPRGLALDGAGNLYIADSNNNVVRRVSPSGTITTVAGTGVVGVSGDDGPATSARLNHPEDVAVDSAGNLYISDAWNDRIRRVSPAGVITTVPGTVGQYRSRGSIAVDSGGNLFYADREQAGWRVRRMSPSGSITSVGPSDLGNPGGLAVDGSGVLYISDSTNSRILRQIGPGMFTVVAGTGAPGFSGDGGIATSAQLYWPAGVAVDARGKIYIADRQNSRIRRVVPADGMVMTGIISTFAGDGTSYYSADGGPATSAQMWPSGVAADAAGNIYISDYSTHRVRRVSPTGIVTTVAGTGAPGFSGDGGAATAAQLRNPEGLAVDGAGNLYITDYNNNRIRRVSPAGIITTVAGNGSLGFSGDGGPATSAALSSPFGVAVDAAGNVYIVDAGNVRIRRVSPSGTISTFAGNGSSGYSGDGGPATAAQLNQIRSVAVDQAGNVYIADADNRRIRRVSTASIITTVAGNGSWVFSGDGGPATSAGLPRPTAVAVDLAGTLYIADGNRIRRVSAPSPFHEPIISTIAGDGADQYSGDGGPATSAQLYEPRDIALDSAGRVYIATANAIRMLTPVSACAPSATPNAFTAVAAGGQFTLNIQAAAGCAWTIAGLPAWITASVTSGSGSAAVTLTAAANSGGARSVTVIAAGTAVAISQAAGAAACTYSISPASQTFSAAGGAGAIAVSATAGCSWTAASPVAWVTITSGSAGTGNGAVNYSVHPTGVTRSSTITVAGLTFAVEQRSGLIAAGTMAQVASGGGWKTTFTLVNIGPAPAMARLRFTGGNGAALALPLTFPQFPGAPPLEAASIEPLVEPGAVLIVESEGPPTEEVRQGWAELQTDGTITGFAVFRQRIGDREQEAVVPLETRSAPGYVLAFDNTGGIDTGVAVANLGSQDGTLTVIINDDSGGHIQTFTLTLLARGHMADELHDLCPATKDKRGTVEFRPPAGGQISVLGLRFNVPKGGAFTTIPVWGR